MKIAAIRTTALSCPCDPPYASAAGVQSRRGALIVEIETDGGIVGIGEAGVGGGVTATVIEKDLAPMLVGEDPFYRERIWQALKERQRLHLSTLPDRVLTAVDAVVMVNSPVEPGVVTGPALVEGPVHAISKLQCASAETGTWNLKRAFGMSKKSVTGRLAMLMLAIPLPSSMGPSVGLGTVQNKPLG